MLEACRPRRGQVLAWGPRRLAAAATGKSQLLQTALPNGVAPSCWSTGAKSCFRYLGCRCVRACRLSCVRTPYPIRRSAIFVVHPRSECRSRNNHLRSQAVYRELQHPYPAVPRDAVFAALDTWWKPLSSGWTAGGVRAVVVFDSRRNPLKQRRITSWWWLTRTKRLRAFLSDSKPAARRS